MRLCLRIKCPLTFGFYFSTNHTTTSGRKWESTYKKIQQLEKAHTSVVTSILGLVIFFDIILGMEVINWVHKSRTGLVLIAHSFAGRAWNQM